MTSSPEVSRHDGGPLTCLEMVRTIDGPTRSIPRVIRLRWDTPKESKTTRARIAISASISWLLFRVVLIGQHYSAEALQTTKPRVVTPDATHGFVFNVSVPAREI